MNNIGNIVLNKTCTGCGSCSYSCSLNIIQMKADEEGFLHPFVDYEKCINCGACSKHCPEASPLERHSVKNGNYYISQYKDRKKIKKSASGGAFAGLATYVLNELYGVVFGASLTDEMVVKHVFIENEAELFKLQNSKYVQSDLNTSYEIVKGFLKHNKYVLFTGTPCQVAGLYSSLGMVPVHHLITADIICHGVPSPLLFEKHIAENSKSWKGKVKSLQFRYKNPIFKSVSSFYMMMRMTRGFPIIRNPANDPYFNIFSKGYGFRESCYNCRYANPNRIGDFTFGDCDSHRYYPQFHPYESNSTLMINSQMAKDLWSSGLSGYFDYSLLDIELEEKYNKQLRAPSSRPAVRDTIYQEIKENEWKDIENMYSSSQSMVRKIRAYLACFLPPKIVRMWGNRNG